MSYPLIASLIAVRIRKQVDEAIALHRGNPEVLGEISLALARLASDLFTDLSKHHSLSRRVFFQAAGVVDLTDPDVNFCPRHLRAWSMRNDGATCPGCVAEETHKVEESARF